MADIATMDVQISQGTNKVGKYISIFISIIFLVIGIIAFLFSWVVGLVCLGVSALFFGISKLSNYATKVNEKTIEKLQNMKEPE